MTPAEVLREHISELEADLARGDAARRAYLETRICGFESAVELLEKAGH